MTPGEKSCTTGLVDALASPSAYPHETTDVEIVETHISIVFLTGRFAYKVKKNVDLGFLDFSSPEKRERYCREELRLNRRLCPELYIDVVPITEKSGRIAVESDGRVIDHAVKMIQFDRNMELDSLLSRNRLTSREIDQIGRIVADFHTALPSLGPDTPYGRPDVLIRPVRDNFTHTARLSANEGEGETLENLRRWTAREHRRLRPLFSSRKISGHVKPCHGDMHTGNMVLWNGRIMIFDCIEFNSFLSNIDVMSEIAFLVMDLEHSGHPQHAWRFLNDYLSLTGDYEGLPLLCFYKTYRAMVRAKVTAIRFLQENEPEERERTLAEHRSYVSLARSFGRRGPFGLTITCGVSGSGKTTVARELAQTLPAVHLRSDVERKRLFGLGELRRSSGERLRELYSEETTKRTYSKLYGIASLCLEEGYSVIVDATFLGKEERRRFIRLAEKKEVPAVVLCCEAPRTILESRVDARRKAVSDASEADRSVLRRQLEVREPLTDEEREIAVFADTADPASIEAAIRTATERIGKPAAFRTRRTRS